MPYFDHSATTPLHPQVIEKMNEVSEFNYGNPSSLYSSGRKSKAIIEKATTDRKLTWIGRRRQQNKT